MLNAEISPKKMTRFLLQEQKGQVNLLSVVNSFHQGVMS